MAVEKTPESYAVQANPFVGSVMLNIRGGSVGEFRENLKEVAENATEISDNLTAITAAGNVNEVLNHGASASSVSAAQAGTTPPPPVAPPAAPPVGGAPTCAHGPRQWKSGTSKAGKPYKMWACNGPRGAQCDPVWA